VIIGNKCIPQQKITITRRPPQVKSSKSQIHAKFHSIPTIRFEDQQLTSFSGLLIFQLLFKRLNLKQRLKNCFSHLKVFPIFGHHLVVMLLAPMATLKSPTCGRVKIPQRQSDKIKLFSAN